MSAEGHTPSQDPASAEFVISAAPSMRELYQSIARLIGHEMTVTLVGEAGTGKSLVAQALHQMSPRRNGPLVSVHMQAMPPDLLAQWLFGREDVGTGKCEKAQGGTLYLDAIEHMPIELQQQWLQLMRQGEYLPLGASQPKKVEFRLVCATQADLMQRVRQSLFLEELYYRLNVIPLRVPPLRERREDIAPLAEFFLRRAAANGLPPRILEADTLAAMKRYAWPGNVRELENMMLRFCTIYNEPIVAPAQFEAEKIHDMPSSQTARGSLAQDIRAHLEDYFSAHREGDLPPPGLYDRILPLFEKPLIEMALSATGGNQVKTAFLLGMNRNTLRKKLTQLGISPEKRV